MAAPRIGLVRLGAALLLLAAWEGAAASGLFYRGVLPSVITIGAALARLLSDPAFWRHLATTGMEVLGALAIGGALGVAVGVLVGGGQVVRRAYEPLLHYVAPTPKIVFLPILITLFGVGPSSKVAMGALSCFFPVALSVMSGMALVNPVHLRVARSFGLSRWRTLGSVYLPSLVRPVVTGLPPGAGRRGHRLPAERDQALQPRARVPRDPVLQPVPHRRDVCGPDRGLRPGRVGKRPVRARSGRAGPLLHDIQHRRSPMTDAAIADMLNQLVIANRILAREDVIDDFGHVSARHPTNPGHYFLSRSRSPEIVTRDDIMEFTLEGEPIEQNGRPMYRERALHGAVYMARPDINCVTHHHARAVLPFTVSTRKLRPIFHMAAVIGHDVPLWDSQAEFGDTNMLVETLEQGHSMARAMGQERCVLLRGHGATCCGTNIKEAVFVSIYMKENAQAVLDALPLGEPTYLTPGEIDQTRAMLFSPVPQSRTWDYRVARAGFRGL